MVVWQLLTKSLSSSIATSLEIKPGLDYRDVLLPGTLCSHFLEIMTEIFIIIYEQKLRIKNHYDFFFNEENLIRPYEIKQTLLTSFTKLRF